ncbi:MAG TPA: hypothetical protein VIP77_25740 [Jiangellaceae bacterium]
MVITDNADGGRPFAPPPVSSPPSRRLRRARWRSPQLIIGVLVVAVSVVVGARVVAAADDTVPVLVAASDIGPGQPLTTDMVESRDVLIDGGYDLYFTGDIGEGLVVIQPLRAGELVPRSAVVPAGQLSTGPDAMRNVTIPVPAAEVPAGLSAGDAVDVWLTPIEGAEPHRARQLATALPVTSVSDTGALGVDGSVRSVTIALTAPPVDADEDPAAALVSLTGQVLTAGRDGRLYLTRVPGVGVGD